MKHIGLFLLIGLFSRGGLCAAPAAAPSASVKGIKFEGSRRLALSYALNQVSEIESKSIDNFTTANGASLDYELGMPFAFCFGINYYQNKDVTVNWKNTAHTPVEFYGYMARLGVKMTVPTPVLQPWIGAGYAWGVLTMSNPKDRETNSGMIGIYSRGSRSAQSPYGTGGIDLRLGTSGIRLAYTAMRPSTEKASEVGDEAYTMLIQTYSAGIFADF